MSIIQKDLDFKYISVALGLELSTIEVDLFNNHLNSHENISINTHDSLFDFKLYSLGLSQKHNDFPLELVLDQLNFTNKKSFLSVIDTAFSCKNSTGTSNYKNGFYYEEVEVANGDVIEVIIEVPSGKVYQIFSTNFDFCLTNYVDSFKSFLQQELENEKSSKVKALNNSFSKTNNTEVIESLELLSDDDQAALFDYIKENNVEPGLLNDIVAFSLDKEGFAFAAGFFGLATKSPIEVIQFLENNDDVIPLKDGYISIS